MGTSAQQDDPMLRLKYYQETGQADEAKKYEQYLRETGQLAAAAAPSAAPLAPRSTLYNTVNTLDNALTLGLGPKFNAALNAAGDVIRGRDSFGHSYTKNVEADQSGLGKLAAEHPYGTAGLNAVGTSAGIIAAAPLQAVRAGVGAADALGGATTAVGRAFAAGKGAAKAGATFGAVNALGNAPNSGTPLDQVVTAGHGALLGGTIGGLFGAGASALEPAVTALSTAGRKGVRTLAELAGRDAPEVQGPAQASARLAAPVGTAPQSGPISGPDAPGADRATALLLKRLARAGLTPQDALDAVAKIPMDKPVSVMEVAGAKSQPVRELGKWVARTPSGGAADLRSLVEQRATPLPNAQRVLGDVADALGADRTNLVEHAGALRSQQKAAAAPHYEAAFQSEPVPLEARADVEAPSLGDLMKRPSMRSALKFHNEIAAERGQEPITIAGEKPSAPEIPAMPPNFAASPEQWADLVATMRERGIPVPGENAPSIADKGASAIALKSLQHIKFALDEMLGFAEQHGRLPDGSAATKERLGAINQTRRDLLGIMTQHSPDYAAGNASFAGDAARQNAVDAGRKFLSRPISELQAEYPTLGPGEQRQHNIGAIGGPIRDRLFKTSAIDRAKILNGPDIQERLGVVASPEGLGRLSRNAGTEHQIALTHQQIPNGSDTFSNLANEMDAGAGGVAAKSALAALLGNPTSAIRATFNNALQPAIARYVYGINEQTANALAPKLSAGMLSRQELIDLLEQLAAKHDHLTRPRSTSSPLFGGAVGLSAGQLSGRRDQP